MPLGELIGIFLDADGVLWSDSGPGAILVTENLEESKVRLREFRNALGQRESYFLTIVSNQTLAARKEITYLRFRYQVQKNMKSLVRDGLIDHFVVCFHHPNAQNLFLRRKNCKCRKPAPGMIIKTMRRFKLSPNNSVLIGDRITDISAANAAGIFHTIMIFNEKCLEINRNIFGESHIGVFLPFNLSLHLSEASEIIKHWFASD